MEMNENEEEDMECNQVKVPRLCIMKREEIGYGFNLHGEKGVAGQYISAVDPGGAADKAGLHYGDRVIEVNGINVENVKHGDVVQHIRLHPTHAALLVVDPITDKYLRSIGRPVTSDMTGLTSVSELSPVEGSAEHNENEPSSCVEELQELQCSSEGSPEESVENVDECNNRQGEDEEEEETIAVVQNIDNNTETNGLMVHNNLSDDIQEEDEEEEEEEEEENPYDYVTQYTKEVNTEEVHNEEEGNFTSMNNGVEDETSIENDSQNVPAAASTEYDDENGEETTEFVDEVAVDDGICVDTAEVDEHPPREPVERVEQKDEECTNKKEEGTNKKEEGTKKLPGNLTLQICSDNNTSDNNTTPSSGGDAPKFVKIPPKVAPRPAPKRKEVKGGDWRTKKELFDKL